MGQCNACGIKVSGRKKTCVECNKKKLHKYYLDNKEAIKERQRAYLIKNKESLKEKRKIYHENNKDQAAVNRKLYTSKNREHVSALQKKHRVKYLFKKDRYDDRIMKDISGDTY